MFLYSELSIFSQPLSYSRPVAGYEIPDFGKRWTIFGMSAFWSRCLENMTYGLADFQVNVSVTLDWFCNNPRFLVLDWVKVSHLTSHVLLTNNEE